MLSNQQMVRLCPHVRGYFLYSLAFHPHKTFRSKRWATSSVKIFGKLHFTACFINVISQSSEEYSEVIQLPRRSAHLTAPLCHCCCCCCCWAISSNVPFLLFFLQASDESTCPYLYKFWFGMCLTSRLNPRMWTRLFPKYRRRVTEIFPFLTGRQDKCIFLPTYVWTWP